MPEDTSALQAVIQPLARTPEDLNAVIDAAKDKTFVLIGEATHGTHEFYETRAAITKRLLQDHGFSAVAIEGDWPDAYRVHRYVSGAGDDHDAHEALAGFIRFPTWMWRNTDILEFVEWLRTFNRTRGPQRSAGFFGLDLYSLHASIEAVINYLERADPPAADEAKRRYSCFDRFGPDTEQYAYAVASGMSASCKEEALAQLLAMQRDAFKRPKDSDDEFFGEQNAFVVASAEEYYRTMLDRQISSWNLRDRFMHATLRRLAAYLERKRARPAKVVVWAHNSHVGDARATSMGAGREVNIGQLCRESEPPCYLIGFTTSTGTVTAASDWHSHAERKTVREPIPQSWEALFHSLDVPDFYLEIESARKSFPAIDGLRLERAIGVVYRPQTEFYSHYMEARLGQQFDAIFHFDRTRAVEPLERTAAWDAGEVPETFPTGI